MRRGASSSTSSPKGKNHRVDLHFYLVGFIFTFLVATAFIWQNPSWLISMSPEGMELLVEAVLGLSQSFYHIFLAFYQQMQEASGCGEQRNCATMGTGGLESPSRSAQQTSQGVKITLMNNGPIDLNQPAAPASSSEEYSGSSCETSSESQSGGSDSVNQGGPLSSDSEASVNQRGGSNVPPLTINLNRPAEDQEQSRQYAEEIRDYRIQEQFEIFINNESTKPLYDQLCAHVGDVDTVKNTCIKEISDNFHSTDSGLFDFVKQTDDSEGQIRVLFDLIELHFKDELDKFPPEPEENENQEEE